MTNAEIKAYLKNAEIETYNFFKTYKGQDEQLIKAIFRNGTLIGACETLLDQVEILESLNKDLEYRIMGLER